MTMRSYLTPVRMAKIKKKMCVTADVGKYVETEKHSSTAGGIGS